MREIIYKDLASLLVTAFVLAFLSVLVFGVYKVVGSAVYQANISSDKSHVITPTMADRIRQKNKPHNY